MWPAQPKSVQWLFDSCPAMLGSVVGKRLQQALLRLKPGPAGPAGVPRNALITNKPITVKPSRLPSGTSSKREAGLSVTPLFFSFLFFFFQSTSLPRATRSSHGPANAASSCFFGTTTTSSLLSSISNMNQTKYTDSHKICNQN